jgi:chromosome partitioning protein
MHSFTTIHTLQETMKTIAIVSQKGGAGKTTLAIHLAVAVTHAGMNAAVIDLDPQASSAKWADRCQTALPVVISAHASRLAQVLEAAKAEGGELAIIDTAPQSDNTALEAARMANVVLVPCRPSILDLEAIANSLDIAKLAHKPATVILNAVSPTGSEANEAAEAIIQLGGETCPVRLVNRVAYARAIVYGQAAQEYEPHGKAAQEIKSLHKFMCAHHHIPTPSHRGKKHEQIRRRA